MLGRPLYKYYMLYSTCILKMDGLSRAGRAGVSGVFVLAVCCLVCNTARVKRLLIIYSLTLAGNDEHKGFLIVYIMSISSLVVCGLPTSFSEHSPSTASRQDV